MKLAEIEKQLNSIFSSPPKSGSNRHIVFWYDPDAEFADDIDAIELQEVRLWKLTGNNNYATKRLLEAGDIQSNFLVYCPGPRPEPRKNWLLDIELYSEQFTADRTEAIMRELGIEDPSLRGAIKNSSKFFNSQERISKFKALGLTEHTEEAIEIGILSVLAKEKVADRGGVFKALLREGLDAESNETYQAIEKMGCEALLAKHAAHEFGYKDTPFDLERFAIALFVSALEHQSDVDMPKTWEPFISREKANCYILIDSLGKQSDAREDYRCLAAHVANKLNLLGYVEEWDPGDYQDCGIFREFDMEIISRIAKGIQAGIDDFEYWRELIASRRTTRWFPDFKHIYDAFDDAIDIFELRAKWDTIPGHLDAPSLFHAYAERYYKMDQAYRRFYTSYDTANKPDILNEVKARVEAVYTNWFLQELSLAWSKRVEEELADRWPMLGVSQQDSFFHVIKEHLERDTRVFVIMSDALRYEVAQELAERIQSEIPGTTKLEAVQGVLPSRTSVGMATALPHTNFAITADGSAIIDGEHTEGAEQRQALLAKAGYPAAVLTFEELTDLTTEQMRARFDGIKVVYIYHNRIDATGDKAASERNVFQACEESIDEIIDAIVALRNKVSATNIYITSDHGFIYTRDPLEESDKITQMAAGGKKPLGRRFTLAPTPASDKGVLSIKAPHKSPDGEDVYVITPKGYIRFKIQGPGINYTHGGASLQEIVVPRIWHRSERAARRGVNKPDIELRSTVNRITNRFFTLEFFQKQPAVGPVQPRTVTARFVDASGATISDEAIIVADSASADPNERRVRTRFTLTGDRFDKNAEYYLVLEDQEETVEKILLKRRFTIDLGISAAFEF